MDEKLQFPGLANTWTMRVENRLDMKLTGIKTPLGLKVQGTNVDGIQQLASQIQDAFLKCHRYGLCFHRRSRRVSMSTSTSIGNKWLAMAILERSAFQAFRERALDRCAGLKSVG
jgi:hypothetical protein